VQSGATTLNVNVVRAIDTLPPGASVVRVISRGPGRGDLVLVTCTIAGVLAIYDDEVGDIVAQVQDLGDQPYALAIDVRQTDTGLGARVYVANFGDGQVSVIDINNLDSPQNAHVMARLGTLQRCAGQQANDDDCTETAP
jgi:DNA-binding beta-propeller fold protein YncE